MHSIQFRFPHAVATCCAKHGFHDAVKMATRLAIIPRSILSEDIRSGAAAFVDQCMKARADDINAKQTHG